MKVKSLIIGFVTGAIVAGTATLLSTPSAGRDLRIRLQNSKDELFATTEELSMKISEIINEVLDAASLSKDSLTTFISDIQYLIRDWKSEIEPSKTELMKNIQEIEASLKELEKIIPDSNHKE